VEHDGCKRKINELKAVPDKH